VQHLPALRQAQAATRPAGTASALRKIAARPVFLASPALAAAVGQAAASISSLPGIASLQAGLESKQAFRALGTAAVLGSPSLRGQGKRGAGTTAAAQKDAAFAQIQVGTGRTVRSEKPARKRLYARCLGA
jgi:hypothetical protein